MSPTHDPACDPYDCRCDLIRTVRAEERRETAEDIATRIETDDQPGHRYDHATATERAAAIARRIGGAS